MMEIENPYAKYRDLANEWARECRKLREKLATVNYIASKASLTDEEKLTDIRNMTSDRSDTE